MLQKSHPKHRANERVSERRWSGEPLRAMQRLHPTATLQQYHPLHTTTPTTPTLAVQALQANPSPDGGTRNAMQREEKMGCESGSGLSSRVWWRRTCLNNHNSGTHAHVRRQSANEKSGHSIHSSGVVGKRGGASMGAYPHGSWALPASSIVTLSVFEVSCNVRYGWNWK